MSEKDSTEWGEGFDLLFDTSPDCLAVVTADEHAFLRVNPSLCAFLDSPPADLIGRPFLDIILPVEDQTVQRALDRVRDGEFGNRFTTRIDRITRPHFLEWRAACLDKDRTFLVGRDVTVEREREDELYRLAHFDTVTTLPNRHLFLDRVNQGLAQARRDLRLAVIVFIDLDNFKPVNDTYGHHIGDEVLQHVANRLASEVREMDTVTRLGGDEFVVFLSMVVDRDLVEPLVKRLGRVFDEPIETSVGRIPITASIGTSIFPEDGDDLDTLLLQADSRMYDHKASKRE